MRRGRRISVAPRLTQDTLERQIADLQQQQADLRERLRRLRNSGSEVRKLEEKLEKQLAGAKWTVEQIKELQPDWDELAFYGSVQAAAPKPRGRRRKSTEGGEPTG